MLWFFSQPPAIRAIIASTLMYAMTALGASFVFFTKKAQGGFLTVLAGMAAGIMIAASFFSLLLPALEYESALPSLLTVTLGFALGGGFIMLADVLLSRSEKRFRAFGGGKSALLYFAVTLHNIPEGMAVGVALSAVATGEIALSAVMLAVGIAAQNFPEGMCVAFPLRAKGLSPFKSFLFAQGSGAVEIPACVLGAVAASLIAGLMPWALAFSAGAMIAVVCSELIPESFSQNKTLASLGVVLGFCVMMALDVALG